jgi:hypothetical protein
MLRTAFVFFALLGAPLTAAERTSKVLFIGVDGCRPDCLLVAKTPNFQALGKGGLLLDEAQTGDITVSGPGWSSMLTGVWRGKHGITDNSFKGSKLADYPHFFARLHEVKPELKFYSASNWDPIARTIVSDATDVFDGKDDDEVEKKALEYMARPDVDVLIAAFDDVDHAGHSTGFSRANPKYLEAIEGIDARVGRLVEAMKARPTYKDESWLIVSTTDHGGSQRNHGQNIPEHRTIFLLVSGDNVQKGRPGVPAAIVDVPAIIARHLAIAPKPEWGWDGVPIGLGIATEATEKPVLLARWAPTGLDESKQSLADSVGQHDGRVEGGVKVRTDDGAAGLEFDGQSAVTIESNAVGADWLPTRAFSVSARVRIDRRQRWGGLIGAVQDDGNLEKGWVLGFDESRLTFAVSTVGGDDGNGQLTYLTSRTAYELGQWYDVVATYDGRVMRLYVNGALESVSRAQTDALLPTKNSPLVLGVYRDSNENYPLTGALGEVRLYRGVLPDSEIASPKTAAK